MNAFRFIAELLPDLVALGEVLYKRFRGDAETARKNIQSRIAEVEEYRAEVDEILKKKHSG